jgi:hypothetical protein
MGEPHEQEQLRERPALAVQALGEPALGDLQELREEPGFVMPRVVAEVFLKRQLGEPESDFVGPALFQVVECIDANLADDPLHFGLGWDVGIGQRELRVGAECRVEPLARQLVAIAEETRPCDLAGDPLGDRPDAGGSRAGFERFGRARAR